MHSAQTTAHSTATPAQRQAGATTHRPPSHCPATATARQAHLQAEAARALHTSAMASLHRVPDRVPLHVMDKVGDAMAAAHQSGIATGHTSGRSEGLRTGLLVGLVTGIMLGMLAMAAATQLGMLYGAAGV